jgi:hypothetical protein
MRYVVIDEQTVKWAQTLILRFSQGDPINRLEVTDIQRNLSNYDDLTVILQEASPATATRQEQVMIA